MPLTLKWGRERLIIESPSLNTTLATLRATIARLTGLGDHDFKLIHKGALMKNDDALLSTYNIQSNSVIAVIGLGEPPPSQAVDSQQTIISVIQAELSAVRKDLSPAVERFLRELAQPPSVSQKKEHIRLGELLLQSLLRLDGVTPDTQWEDARRERKDAVREVQTLLDQLDAAWATKSI